MLRAALIACGAALFALPALAEIVSARYADPTPRYNHAVLGDALEWGALELSLQGGRRVKLVLPPTHVFEDIAPRLADLDGDGDAEVIVVETDITRGAQLAIYDESGKITATPYIGQTRRWLAPVGAADLDGDGHVEIAYIDRPHLAKTLRIWRFRDRRLEPVTDALGYTNHRIGDDYISGGIRDCGQGPEMVVTDANWTRVLALSFKGGRLSRSDLGAYVDRQGMASLTACGG